MLPSLVLLMLMASAALVLVARRSQRQLGDLQQRLVRLEQWRLERERMAAQIQQLQQLQRVAESTVATGAATVRTLHLGIAAIPFGILEAIPVTRDTTRIVRALHDQISDVVYEGIVGTNRLLGSVIRQGIACDAKAVDVRTTADPRPALDKPSDEPTS